MKKDWRDRIRETLERLGWSMRTLSERSDVEYRTLQNYVGGAGYDGPEPNRESMVKLSKALNVPMDYLFDSDADWPPPDISGRIVIDLNDPMVQKNLGVQGSMVIPILRLLSEAQKQDQRKGDTHTDRQ